MSHRCLQSSSCSTKSHNPSTIMKTHPPFFSLAPNPLVIFPHLVLVFFLTQTSWFSPLLPLHPSPTLAIGNDWQINICLATCLRNQKQGAVRISCQEMRLGALVICWGLQSFWDKVAFNECKKPPCKKRWEGDFMAEGNYHFFPLVSAKDFIV